MKYEQKFALIQIGHPKHLDQLVHDEDPDVRRYIAICGNKNHAKTLLNDPLNGVKIQLKRDEES